MTQKERAKVHIEALNVLHDVLKIFSNKRMSRKIDVLFKKALKCKNIKCTTSLSMHFLGNEISIYCLAPDGTIDTNDKGASVALRGKDNIYLDLEDAYEAIYAEIENEKILLR